MRWTSLVLILLAVVERALGGCAYADLQLPANAFILVADASCTSTLPVCAVRPNCKVFDSFTSDGDSYYVHFDAIGDLSGYTQPNLSVANSSFLTLAKIKVPPTLTSLTLTNISRVHLGGIQTAQWSALTDLTFDNASIVLINTIEWPSSLRSAMFRDIYLNNIPQGLPSTVQELAMQGNKLVDLMYLPGNLTLLNLAVNLLPSITDRDWRALTFLRLSGNKKLQSITRVQLSTQLEYFDMRDCPQLTNITIDASTFAALDALPNAGDADQDSVYRGFAVNNDISADATACSAVNGTIQRLWKSASKYVVDVCVLPVAPSTTSPPSPPPRPTPSNMGLIIGVVVGGLVVLGAIVAFVILKRRTVKPPPTPVYYPYEGGDNFDTVNDGRTLGSNGTKIIDTNGTWGATSGYRN